MHGVPGFTVVHGRDNFTCMWNLGRRLVRALLYHALYVHTTMLHDCTILIEERLQFMNFTALN